MKEAFSLQRVEVPYDVIVEVPVERYYEVEKKVYRHEVHVKEIDVRNVDFFWLVGCDTFVLVTMKQVAKGPEQKR